MLIIDEKVTRAKVALAEANTKRIGRVICPHGGCLGAWIVRTPVGFVFDPVNVENKHIKRNSGYLPVLLADAEPNTVMLCVHGQHTARPRALRDHFTRSEKSYTATCTGNAAMCSAGNTTSTRKT